jgi:predicted nucleotidyltransferase
MVNELPSLSQHLHLGLQELVHALEKRGLRYTLIGGLAAGFRGRPRFTQDIDFLLEVPQLVLPALLEELKERGFSFETETAIREWTREHMTVLSFQGVQIDWLKPVVPLYQHVIDSARPEEWLGTTLRIASTEGLILTKLIASRTQDQADIESLLASNQGQLDVDLIRREWLTVSTANDPRMQRFEEMVRLYYLSSPSPTPPTDSNP